MALALAGGAFVSSFLNVLFDRMASHEVVDFFKGQKLDLGLLEKLEIILNSVDGVLNDAEEKQITKPAVKKWLDMLKDAAYEADDLLDSIAYEAIRLELEAGSQTSTDQAQILPSSSDEFNKRMEKKSADMSARLEKVLGRLDLLLKQIDILGLRQGFGEKPWSWKVPTTSLVDESGVCGRDDDKEAIMKLLQLDDAIGNDLDVIPIVGMGGVGKTTLAQLVYSDKRVQEWFDLKAWVCVSEDYNVFKITKEILKQVTSETCDIMTPNQLHLELQKSLMGKKLLLVLDDVWNDNYADWDSLQTPLKDGARGSKIIVTTRNNSVASTMRTAPTHHLETLSVDDCWFVFAKYAFGDGDLDQNLEEIGRDISRKCKGLPLAAKTLGSLLRCERDVEKWRKVWKSNLWDSPNSILPALRLSYHHLPSHLKQCFAYCAIFPKGYYGFGKEEIILLWMAEGFLGEHRGDKEMEEVGDEYFHDLVSRSFFQQSYVDGYFVMHDLINDLAKLVCGEFSFSLEGGNSCKISEKVRHLSFPCTEFDGFHKFEGIYKAKHLRTFLPLLSIQCASFLDNEVIHDFVPALLQLRVLSLSHYVSVVMLPDSIGNLKHLRYLNLEATRIEKLPETVSTLYNLQTLSLHKCEHLVQLPKNMRRLINLRHLDIKGTQLQEMPPQMGKLKNLQMLTDFILGKQHGSSIKELGYLQHLRGRLCIWNLQNVLDTLDTSQDILKHTEHRKALELRWLGDTEDSLQERGVLERLQPHTNIKSLSIVGYGGTRFADWLGDSSFSDIVSLELTGCKYCSSLPPLGQLASLEDLSISGFDSLVTVGPGFYRSCSIISMSMNIPFRSLKTLKFKHMPQWQEWIIHEPDEVAAFPHLKYLSIKECPNLSKACIHQFASLEKLDIIRCEQLMVQLPMTTTVMTMKLKDDFHRVNIDKLLSGLHRLCIEWFHSLHSLIERKMQMGGLWSSLEKIYIRNYNSLKCFQLEFLPKLKSLCIEDCPHLISLLVPEQIFGNSLSLSNIEINSCPNFSISYLTAIWNLSTPHPTHSTAPATLEKMSVADDSRRMLLGKLTSGMYRLEVEGFESLSSPIPEGMEEMHGLSTALEEIVIRRYDLLKCLQLELFINLKTLCIKDCPYLESLSVSKPMHANFLPLSYLVIYNCPNFSVSHFPTIWNFSISHSLLPSPRINIERLEVGDFCNNLLIERLASGMYRFEVDGFPSLDPLCILIPEGLEQMQGLSAALEEIEIRSYDSIKCLSLELFPMLKKLDVSYCPIFESFSASDQHLQQLTHFTFLSVENCPGLISFPKGGLAAPNLTQLRLLDCVNLKCLPERMHFLLPSLVHLIVENCVELESFPEGGFPSKLESLVIQNCKKLIGNRMEWDLQNLSSLSQFVIGGTDDLECFPEETLLPYSLTSLSIMDLKNLKSLNYKGLEKLTSLQELRIWDCPNLQCLPEQGLPSSLSTLIIWKCPLLEQRCVREIGEDWPKISHISYIIGN